ncbi:regulatory family [Leptolyngbya sp. Heron Island J]|uniref:FmdB family zinc ribbon protein n=1 Tax=Leptolyngbya sp. Heron Island J TaxID=1385935 RepID=UPI0003B9490A|nr:zinc ribbon domain-containing protein [Leptolyngbya sp. Heron Island J]ESA38426.1 regulatory family [Leptolyngbya sp. Heron Island J]
MPLYDYKCADCGPFDVWRKMAEVTTPLSCPSCGVIATRVFTAPNISLSTGSLSRMSSSLEPRLVKRQGEPATPIAQSPTGGRPWMIGHAAKRL